MSLNSNKSASTFFSCATAESIVGSLFAEAVNQTAVVEMLRHQAQN